MAKQADQLLRQATATANHSIYYCTRVAGARRTWYAAQVQRTAIPESHTTANSNSKAQLTHSELEWKRPPCWYQ